MRVEIPAVRRAIGAGERPQVVVGAAVHRGVPQHEEHRDQRRGRSRIRLHRCSGPDVLHGDLAVDQEVGGAEIVAFSKGRGEEDGEEEGKICEVPTLRSTIICYMFNSSIVGNM